ncbi:MAG: Wzz/FepE/Etk N-terminal domain-containing protein, partial [Sporichthyaceae bacterium]|nr:Wzz/FepE/Etk N-terminal domain-containing protein [Sporichthyaceae bacterium]
MEPVVELRPGFLASVVRQRWRFVLVCALAGLFAVAGLSVLRGPSYTATAVVLLNPLAGNPYSPTTSTLRNDQLNSLETEAALVSTQSVSERAVGKSGGLLGEAAGDQVAVEVLPAATVLRISFIGGSATKARVGAQSFAEAFLDYRRAQAEAAVAEQIDLIDAQIKGTRDAMRDASDQLADAAQGSVEELFLENQLQVYVGQLAQLDAELVLARNSARDPGQVITPATMPATPDGLPRWLLLIGGLFAGLATGVMISLWREHNDDRIREPDDVAALGLPRMLAVVPPTAGTAVFEDASAEGFQMLRSSVLARLPRQPAVISVCPVGTEIRSGDLAFALAAALERSGRRIVLILGQTGPQVPYVWAPPGAGLADALLDPGRSQRVDDLLHELWPNLRVLPPGRALKDAADLYQSTAMEDVIRRLRNSADIILVAAPSLDSAAGRTLAGVADSVLLVIGMAETKHGTLLDAYDELAFRNVSVIGVAGVSRARRRKEPRRYKGGGEVSLGDRLAMRP